MRSIFDAEWRARALGGSADAVRCLAEEALQPLYSFCLYRVGRNRHLCEEVVQETYVRAFTHLAEFRGGSSLATWLSRIAINEALGRLRSERPSVALASLPDGVAEAEVVE